MVTSESYEDLVKCGYMDMKLPRKHRKFTEQAWKRRWFILRRRSSLGGNPRLEYHKNKESCLQPNSKTVVDLKGLVTIEQLAQSRSKGVCFKLVFKDFYIVLAPAQESNIKDWVRLITKLVFPQPLATPEPCRGGSYIVTVIQTDASEQCGLAGSYLLSITSEKLSLQTRNSDVNSADVTTRNNDVISWHLDDIPRFRLQKLNQLYDSEKIFTINLARENGMKEFQFLTSNGRDILETVKSHTTRPRTRIHNSIDSSTSSVDDGASSESSFENNNESSRCSIEGSIIDHASHRDLQNDTIIEERT